MTGSPSSSWVPSRPSPDSSSSACASRAASHAAASGSSATTGASTGRGLCGSAHTVVTATRVTGSSAAGDGTALTPAILAPRPTRGRTGHALGTESHGAVGGGALGDGCESRVDRDSPVTEPFCPPSPRSTVENMDERIILEGFDPPKNRRHGPDGDIVDVQGWLHAPVDWTGGPALERAWRERHGRSRLGVGLCVANSLRRHFILTNVPDDPE